MPDAEIDAVRRMLASRPRPASLAERRRRLDGLGEQSLFVQEDPFCQRRNDRERFAIWGV
jgi:hypothetical protein